LANQPQVTSVQISLVDRPIGMMSDLLGVHRHGAPKVSEQPILVVDGLDAIEGQRAPKQNSQ
jgi:hypothetical protein